MATYQTVSFTANTQGSATDMNKVVNNTRATDAHNEGETYDNAKYLAGKDTGGTARNLVGVNASDQFVLGNATTPLFMNGYWDGWMSLGDTWTYASASTFTVPTDVTAKYRTGNSVRWKEGGAYKYGVIAKSAYGAPNTTVTLIENTTYVITNTTLTDNYISNVAQQGEGIPTFFTYTPSYTNITAGSGTTSSSYRVFGREMTVTVKFTLGAGSAIGTAPTFSLPGGVASGSANAILSPVVYADAGVRDWIGAFKLAGGGTTVSLITLNTGLSYLDTASVTASAPFSWGSGDYFEGTIAFPFITS